MTSELKINKTILGSDVPRWTNFPAFLWVTFLLGLNLHLEHYGTLYPNLIKAIDSWRRPKSHIPSGAWQTKDPYCQF